MESFSLELKGFGLIGVFQGLNSITTNKPFQNYPKDPCTYRDFNQFKFDIKTAQPNLESHCASLGHLQLLVLELNLRQNFRFGPLSKRKNCPLSVSGAMRNNLHKRVVRHLPWLMFGSSSRTLWLVLGTFDPKYVRIGTRIITTFFRIQNILKTRTTYKDTLAHTLDQIPNVLDVSLQNTFKLNTLTSNSIINNFKTL